MTHNKRKRVKLDLKQKLEINELDHSSSQKVIAAEFIIIKAENYMLSGVVGFGLWLWEQTACRRKNIDLQICSEVIYCESEIAELVYTTKSQGNEPTFLSSDVWM